jgi:hypothetical protein
MDSGGAVCMIRGVSGSMDRIGRRQCRLMVTLELIETKSKAGIVRGVKECRRREGISGRLVEENWTSLRGRGETCRIQPVVDGGVLVVANVSSSRMNTVDGFNEGEAFSAVNSLDPCHGHWKQQCRPPSLWGHASTPAETEATRKWRWNLSIP